MNDLINLSGAPINGDIRICIPAMHRGIFVSITRELYDSGKYIEEIKKWCSLDVTYTDDDKLGYPAVYVYADKNKGRVYVGETKSLQRRMYEHTDDRPDWTHFAFFYDGVLCEKINFRKCVEHILTSKYCSAIGKECVDTHHTEDVKHEIGTEYAEAFKEFLDNNQLLHIYPKVICSDDRDAKNSAEEFFVECCAFCDDFGHVEPESPEMVYNDYVKYAIKRGYKPASESIFRQACADYLKTTVEVVADRGYYNLTVNHDLLTAS